MWALQRHDSIPQTSKNEEPGAARFFNPIVVGIIALVALMLIAACR
jgi:hypothetical protein